MFLRRITNTSATKLVGQHLHLRNSSNGSKKIDKSKVPQLIEKDLEEHFIKGSGPGGSRVNKKVNCVYLCHKPTGLQVKVHETREQYLNRKLAREKLIALLDAKENGQNSVENQIKKAALENLKKKFGKQKKLSEMKAKWKDLKQNFIKSQ